MFYLYKITNQLSQKVYIGQSNKETERWRQHKYFSRQEKPIQYIHRAIAKYGVENFTYEVIAMCKKEDDVDELETQLIKQCDSQNKLYGYNIAPGGETPWNRGLPREQQPMFGKKQSEFFLKRMSEVHTGKLAPHSQEWKDNMSKTMKGREITWSDKIVETRKSNGSYTISENEKNRLRTMNIGKILSQDHKKKISDSNSGDKSNSAKLTWSIVEAIRLDRKNYKMNYKQLGEKYSVDKTTIGCIIRNETWKNSAIP